MCPLVAQQLVPLTGRQESGRPLESLPKKGSMGVAQNSNSMEAGESGDSRLHMYMSSFDRHTGIEG